MESIELIEENRKSNENLLKTIELAKKMLELANEGDRDRLDDTCGIVFGILRDSAYQIRKIAEEECKKHKKAGRWY